MIIKVCGMREPENIRAIEQAGADWMGFIFFPQSARYVSHRPEYLPEQCHRIGVFVNESSENILLKAQEFGLHHIQLHGRETPEQCRKLKAAGLGVIKVFSIAQKSDLQSAGCYEGICDYFRHCLLRIWRFRQNLQLEYPASLSGKDAFPAEWRSPARQSFPFVAIQA